MRYPFRRRRFGQHFLHDRGVIARLVELIAPGDGLAVIEIGPGRGALTLPLLRRLGRLDVVEIDTELAARLPQVCAGAGELRVHCCDVLRFDLATAGDGPFRLAGNLPYNISTPLLFHLLGQAERITEMIFMLQKEVVARLAAEPDTRDYGRLSVTVQARCTVEQLFEVGAGAFQPPPRVESAVVRLRPRRDFAGQVRDPALFGRLVQCAFQQRRKMLRNSIHELLPQGEADLAALGLHGMLRAENLRVDQYIALANHLATRQGA